MPHGLKPAGPGRYGATRYRWVDVVTMAYMGATGGLYLLLGYGHPGWLLAVLLHAAYVAFGLEVVRASQRHTQSRLLRELRTWYPAFLILYGFFDVGRLQALLSKGSFWATASLVRIDAALFHTHLTLWIQRLHGPMLDEVVCFFNVSYYAIPFLFAIPLLVVGRRTDVWAGASIVLTCYVVNYTLFMLLPAVGPRMVPAIESLRTVHIAHDGLFTRLDYLIQGDHGAVRGNAFPSAHVSGAVAWTLAAWRYQRRMVWPLAVLTAGTAFSTIYLGFHYAVDPVAGAAVSVACYCLVVRIMKARGEDPASDRETAAIDHRPAPTSV